MEKNLNFMHLLYLFPLTAILSGLLVYKFHSHNNENKTLNEIIIHGIITGICSSFTIPLLFILNLILTGDIGLYINTFKKELILNLFVFSLFIFIGALAGISVSVFNYNRQRKKTKKDNSL
ncbi:hypothetical protein HZA55_06050 [Candidatus Poribacteria bacterium]|nr:hypothetical protein [Candidatus Poribacteria bacterium]